MNIFSNTKFLTTYILTYVAYISIYMLRKPLPVSKPYISQEFKICSKLKLSFLDNCHLVPYALLSIIFPNLIDQAGGKISFVSACFVSSLLTGSVYYLKFILPEELFQSGNSGFLFLCLITFLNGSVQAFGWPAAIKCMSEFSLKGEFKKGFPVWTTSLLIGGTLGGILSGYTFESLGSDRIVDKVLDFEGCQVNNTLEVYNDETQDGSGHLDWRLVYFLPTLPLILWCGVMWLTYPKPMNAEEKTEKTVSKPDVSMLQIFQDLPGIMPLAISYAFAKGCKYWYFFWAPDWLVTEGNYSISEAAYINTSIEIGGILSCLVLPFLITSSGKFNLPQKLNKNWTSGIPPMYLAAGSALLSIPTIFLARFLVITMPDQLILVSLCLVSLGFIVALPTSLYSGVSSNASADLDGRNLHGAAAGIVNGFGSFGAVILNPFASFVVGLDPNGGYKYAIITMAISMILCCFFALRAHKQLEAAKLAQQQQLSLQHTKTNLLQS